MVVAGREGDGVPPPRGGGAGGGAAQPGGGGGSGTRSAGGGGGGGGGRGGGAARVRADPTPRSSAAQAHDGRGRRPEAVRVSMKRRNAVW